MNDYEKLREKFNADVAELQNIRCSHKDISDWQQEYWALAHSTGKQIKVCLNCFKVVEKK
jgi:hypothetical protein